MMTSAEASGEEGGFLTSAKRKSREEEREEWGQVSKKSACHQPIDAHLSDQDNK